jgi:hypothetical protein
VQKNVKDVEDEGAVCGDELCLCMLAVGRCSPTVICSGIGMVASVVVISAGVVPKLKCLVVLGGIYGAWSADLTGWDRRAVEGIDLIQLSQVSNALRTISHDLFNHSRGRAMFIFIIMLLFSHTAIRVVPRLPHIAKSGMAFLTVQLDNIA